MRNFLATFMCISLLIFSTGAWAQTVVLDGVPVGTTNPNTGKFTNLEATTQFKLGADTATSFDGIDSKKVKSSATDTTSGFLTDELVAGSNVTLSGTENITISVADKLTTKGDVLIHNGTSETRLAVGASGQFLTSDATGALLWANPAEGDQLFNSNVLLNAYRTAENGSRPVLKIIDGVVDAFEGETGVDATASTNESYDSSNDYYEPTSSAGTTIPMVNFDGTNDYLTRGADLTGNADGKKGIFSAWVDFTGSNSVQSFFINSGTTASGKIRISKETSNKIRIEGSNSSGTVILRADSTASYNASSGLIHILCSWDLSVPEVNLYINDASAIDLGSGTKVATNDTLDYTSSNYSIGGDTAGSARLNADLGQLYFNNSEYIDISVTANRRKFIDFTGNPVGLGSDGSTPTGTKPIIFQNNTLSTWQTNLGSGGGFTENGALTAGTDISTTGTPNNLTLISNSQTAKTEPNGANILLLAEDLAADITINTDIKASVSRDGGTTFTQVTLADAGEFEDGNLLTGTVDISSQPTGTNMEWKVESLNNKFLNLHGVGLEWR